jgi:branched-chain amino acid transport system permease protein
MALAAPLVGGVPLLSTLVSPERWLLWLGVLFVLSVYHFPNGIVGRLRAMRTSRHDHPTQKETQP